MNNIDVKQLKPLMGGGRNEIIDSIKCYLMFLVVYGHVLLLTTPFYEDRAIQAFISWIWYFHMPAFALVSGYVFKVHTNSNKLFSSCGKLLLTYVIMQVVLTLIYGPRDIVSFLFVPQYAMWYLPALVVWRLLSFYFSKISSNLWILLVICIIISLISGFIPLKYMGFQRICSFSPFFVLGSLYREKNVLNLVRENRKIKILSLVVLSALFIIFLIPNQMITSGMCNEPYQSIFQLLMRITVLIIGTIMSTALLSIAPNNQRASETGKHTLFIYCFHVFFLLQIIPFIWQKLGITPNLGVLAIYSVAVFLLLAMLSKDRFLNKLINPFYK